MKTYRHHAPGHVREAFQEAVQKLTDWRGIGPEPTVEFEVDAAPQAISISQAATLVRRYTDILPRDVADDLRDHGLKTPTYAAGARAVWSALKWYRAQAAA